ncbi:MAG: antibiotic biosynthesis monooxygenase [Bacteroidia bacterium]|nr:antibiotic biosynthesis monooxygenase [Bacteroidia bacterium]
MLIAATPAAPYYAVIFTSLRTEGENGYKEMSDRMNELAARQPGFLGQETVREVLGVSVSYWRTLEDVRNWKRVAEHVEAQQKGKDVWYTAYRVRVCLVERDYGWEKKEV